MRFLTIVLLLGLLIGCEESNKKIVDQGKERIKNSIICEKSRLSATCLCCVSATYDKTLCDESTFFVFDQCEDAESFGFEVR